MKKLNLREYIWDLLNHNLSEITLSYFLLEETECENIRSPHENSSKNSTDVILFKSVRN